MKKLWNWLDVNWYLVLGLIFSFGAFYIDCFGKGNKEHAIAWALLIIVYLFLIKGNADRRRQKEIKERLDILFKRLNSLEAEKKLLEQE